MTESSTTTLISLLRRIPAFQGVDDAQLQYLSQQAQPFHCTVGQDLLLADRVPEYCF